MKMHKKHIISLVTLACLAASSSVFAATPETNVPNPVKGDAGTMGGSDGQLSFWLQR